MGAISGSVSPPLFGWYVNIDGAIDMPFIHQLRPDLPKEDMLQPSAIAETYWHIAHQDPSAWTQEVDVRPFKERF